MSTRKVVNVVAVIAVLWFGLHAVSAIEGLHLVGAIVNGLVALLAANVLRGNVKKALGSSEKKQVEW